MNPLTLQKYRIFKAWLRTKPAVWEYHGGQPVYDYSAFTAWWEAQRESFKAQVVKGEHEEPVIY